MRWIGLPVITTVVLAACGGSNQQAQETAPAGQTSADTVAVAMSRYDQAAFDTITWSSDSVMLARGAVVFNTGCAKCHGPQGLGNGGYVLHGDTLRPPNFTNPDWHLAGDIDGIRRKVYSGNVQGMPHWGLRLMAPRDIDAVAHYINDVLHGQAQH